MSEVKVEQVDATCVADLLAAADELRISGNDIASIRLGIWNDETAGLGQLLRIAARHRAAAIEEAAKEADRHIDWQIGIGEGGGDAWVVADEIAQDIRALAQQETGNA